MGDLGILIHLPLSVCWCVDFGTHLFQICCCGLFAQPCILWWGLSGRVSLAVAVLLLAARLCCLSEVAVISVGAAFQTDFFFCSFADLFFTIEHL